MPWLTAFHRFLCSAAWRASYRHCGCPTASTSKAKTSSCTVSGRVRRWLHLPPRWQRPAGLLCRALPILVAGCLSSSVAGGAAPCRAPCALQPLAVQALRAHLAGWYRICLLLRVDRSEGTTDSQRFGEQEHPALWSTGGKLCRQISRRGRRTSAALL